MSDEAKQPQDADVLLKPSYLADTREPIYGLVVVIPMLVLYEATLFLAGPSQVALQVRNATDVLIKAILERLGPGAHVASSLIIIAALGILQLTRKRQPVPRLSYLGFLLLESTLYALALLGLSVLLDQYLLTNGPGELGLVQRISLSLGAGIYEEFLFRLLLIPAIVAGARLILGETRTEGLVAALVVSAVLFALSHNIALGSEQFAWYPFVFRTLSGAALGAIFLTRGFGAAAASHAIYDVVVSVIISGAV